MPAMPRWTKVGRPAASDDQDAALRILLDDEMMTPIARTGRFRLLAQKTEVAAPGDALAGHRLVWIDLVDYERDRSFFACVDLDRRAVASLRCEPADPRLAPEEEAEALDLALADRRVAGGIALGDAPQAILHLGSRAEHRSAAVVFGNGGLKRSPPSLVAVVDLWLRVVTRVERPEQ